MELHVLTGADLTAVLPDVARLRIEVFREWPYLYDGDTAYEEAYLRPFAESAKAIVVGAFDGDDLVGASTGAPLLDHAGDFAAAFDGSGYALERVFYCAESVLRPAYRGRGVGHGFFDKREDHARQLGFAQCAFCAVTRPPDHPRKPETYRPLAPFWRGRGYVPLDGVVARFAWKDIGQADQSSKPLQFWIKTL